MSREVDYQVATMRHVRAVTEREATKPTYRTGVVTAVDPSSRVVTVSIDGGSEIPIPVIDDNYVPRVGHQIVIPMNGDEPVGARPPKGPDVSVILNPDGAITGDDVCPNRGFEGTIKYPGVAPWTGGTNVTLAQGTVTFRTGTKALQLTRNTSTGIVSATFPLSEAPVAAPGVTYNAVGWSRAGTTVRSSRIDIEFYNAANTLLDSFSSPAANNSNAVWTEYWMSGVAPETATKWRPVLYNATASNAVAGEVHHWDDVNMWEGVPGAGVSGAKAWLFDATAESWTNVTWTADGALSGGGCIITNAGASNPFGPYGTSGEPVLAGKKYTAFMYVKPVENNGTERTAVVRVNWYNSGGTFISTSTGPSTLLSTGIWNELALSGVTSPGGAAFANVDALIASPGGGQQWRVDTAVLTKPPSVRIRRNLNTTYTQGKATSIEVRALATGVGVVQFPPGLNNDTATPIPVIVGDSWRLSCSYVNDAANATKRNVALVATWYDDTGGFIGVDIKQTPISTNPSTNWQTVTDTFKVPSDVAFMRSRIVYLPGAVGETLYLQDVITQRVPDSDSAVQPRGPVHAQIAANSYPDFIISTVGLTWVMTDWFLVTDTIKSPITLEVVLNGFFYAQSGVSSVTMRAGMSFDWGNTVTYGQNVAMDVDAGYLPAREVSFRHLRSDVPVGGVYVWAEIYQAAVAAGDLNGQLSWRTIPT